MFIIAKQSVQFTHPVTGDNFPVANGFSGDVPDWIADTDLFKQIARAGTESVIQVVDGAPKPGVPYQNVDGQWMVEKDGVIVLLTPTTVEVPSVAPKTQRKHKVESGNEEMHGISATTLINN